MLKENEALLIHFYLHEISYFSPEQKKTIISEKFVGILKGLNRGSSFVSQCRAGKQTHKQLSPYGLIMQDYR